jgi:dipeptidyl aminopeptidase/acylaminoacyl peptidase
MGMRSPLLRGRHRRLSVRSLQLFALVALLSAGSSWAQPSPTGKYVVVRENAAGQNWLELRSISGGEVGVLTPPPVRGELRDESDASFSPDGSQLVFERRTPAASKLLLLNLETGRLRTLLQAEPRRSWEVAWAQDSRSVLFSTLAFPTRRSGLLVGRVHRLPVDGSVNTISTYRSPAGSTWPTGTSPDGSTVLVVESAGEALYFHYKGPDILYALGKGSRVKLASTRSIGDAIWSPDGAFVAYAGNCYSLCQIQAVRPDGRGHRALTRFRTRTTGEGGYDQLSFRWGGRPGEVVYGRGRTLYGVDTSSGKQRKIRTFPCRRACPYSETTIVAIARDRASAYVEVAYYSGSGDDAETDYRTYLVSLLNGSFTETRQLANAAAVWFESDR